MPASDNPIIPDDDNSRLISYRLSKLEQAVIELIRSHQELQHTFVRQDTQDLKNKIIEEKVKELDGRMDKLGNALLGVVTTVIAIVLASIVLYFIFGTSSP